MHHKSGRKSGKLHQNPPFIISPLSIFSKIIGKLTHKRLSGFLEMSNVIHSLQYGFRRKHSTAHALISLTERIKQTIDDSNFSCDIFIDLKKVL